MFPDRNNTLITPMNPHCVSYHGDATGRHAARCKQARDASRDEGERRKRRCALAWPSGWVSRLTYRVWFIVIVNDRVYPSIHGAAICPATCLTAQCTSMLPRVIPCDERRSPTRGKEEKERKKKKKPDSYRSARTFLFSRRIGQLYDE